MRREKESWVRWGISTGMMLVISLLGTAIITGTGAALFWIMKSVEDRGWIPRDDRLDNRVDSAHYHRSRHRFHHGATYVLPPWSVRSPTASEQNIMQKLSFFQWFNVVVSAVAMVFIPTPTNQSPNNRFNIGWYAAGGQLIIQALFGDMIIIQLGLDSVRPGHRRSSQAREAASTQQRMNELYEVPADDARISIQLMNKLLSVGLMFSFGLPILYLIIAAFFWLGHWVDRHTLLRRISPRVATYDRMMDWVLRKVLPLSIALHVMMAFVFFNDICVTTGERIETTQSTQFMCERLVLRAATASARKMRAMTMTSARSSA